MSNNLRRITVAGQFPAEQQQEQPELAQLVAVADEIQEQQEDDQLALLIHEVRGAKKKSLAGSSPAASFETGEAVSEPGRRVKRVGACKTVFGQDKTGTQLLGRRSVSTRSFANGTPG